MHIRKAISIRVRKFIEHHMIPLRCHRAEKRNRRIVERLKQKEQINVVFIITNLPMWKYQNLCKAMMADPRYKVVVVTTPNILLVEEEKVKDMKMLKEYFTATGIPFVEGCPNGKPIDVKGLYAPDLIFYAVPYTRVMAPEHSYKNFPDALLAYYPYAYWMESAEDWCYNLDFHNVAWKLFYPTQTHLEEARRYAYNKARNVEVVGNPPADAFLDYTPKESVWKPQDHPKKKVIWAPHWSIWGVGPTHQSNFLWMADFMVEMAKKYQDKIQFSFKPHPCLLNQLCKHKDWGKEKAEAYYEIWRSSENTQFDSGEYMDLFMTSDAMVHDSSSFSAEYHYSHHPAMFITQKLDEHLAGLNEIGKKATLAHYIGKCKEDIERFIEEVVLQGKDEMLEQRKDFCNRYLLPPAHRTVVENTLEVLRRELGR